MVASKAKSKTVRALRGGQMTIPIEFRRELGIEDDTFLKVTLSENGELIIRRVEEKPSGSDWLREVYEAFEPVRREIREKGMTEEEVDSLFDEAFREVRAELYGSRQE